MVYYIGSVPCAPSDLQHWGIKGQKWGIRRFRNPDGTLTDAGKARYAASTGKKNVLDFTDKELKSAVERLRNEQAWKTLIKELDKPKKATGKELVKKALDKFGSELFFPFAKSAASTAGKAVVDIMADETKAQNAEQREKERKRKERKEEEERKKRHAESLWDEDRFDY